MMRFPHEILCSQIRQLKCQWTFGDDRECVLRNVGRAKWNGKTQYYSEITITTIFTAINKYFRIPAVEAAWKLPEESNCFQNKLIYLHTRTHTTCKTWYNHFNGSVFSHIVSEHAQVTHSHIHTVKKSGKSAQMTSTFIWIFHGNEAGT